jgi:hypothetical protein
MKATKDERGVYKNTPKALQLVKDLQIRNTPFCQGCSNLKYVALSLDTGRAPKNGANRFYGITGHDFFSLLQEAWHAKNCVLTGKPSVSVGGRYLAMTS